MIPEAMNIAIAEHLGWHVLRPVINNCILARKSQKDGWSVPPNYVGDLNAMHEAEITLDPLKMLEYAELLRKMCGSHSCIRANATYRSEAFLRTVGKWKEGE